MNTKEFIEKAKNIHNTKYNYSKVIYTHSKHKVIIICDEHGEFLQTPSGHLSGKGCKACSILARVAKQKSTAQMFIDKANIIHNNKYLYLDINYISAKHHIHITCRLHGNFIQTPRSHLRGSGCPKCANASRTDLFYNRLTRLKYTPTIFYCIKYKDIYKIGVTTKNIHSRYLKEVDNTDDIEIIEIINFAGYKEAYDYEQHMVDKLKEYKYDGDKVFNITGNTEIFTTYIKFKEE